MKSALTKAYRNTKEKFQHLVASRKQNVAILSETFDKMRTALIACIEGMDFETAAQECFAITEMYRLDDIEQITSDDIAIDCSLSTLFMELGWQLCFKHETQKSEPLFLSIIAQMASALLHYIQMSTLCADMLPDTDADQKTVYYETIICVYETFTTFLTQLALIDAINVKDINTILLENYLKLSQCSITQQRWDDAEKYLRDYEIILPQCEEYNADNASLYTTLQTIIAQQKEDACSKKEKNRINKKKAILNKIEKKIEPTEDITVLNDLISTLEQKKATETHPGLLKKMNDLQEKISGKIAVLTQAIIRQTISEIIDAIAIHAEKPVNISQDNIVSDTSNAISEQITEILTHHVDDVSELTEDSPPLHVEASETTKEIINDMLDQLTVYALPASQMMPQEPFQSPPATVIFSYFVWPECLKNGNIYELFFMLCDLAEKYDGNMYLNGSANRLMYPNDLDLLVDSTEFNKIQNIIGELVVLRGGTVIANYKKYNRHVIKMQCNGVALDFVLSTKTIVEHAMGSFSINTYFDMRKKIMLCVHSDAFLHIETKQLHTISDARWTFADDPYRIFRAIYLCASEGYSFSLDDYWAIQDIFATRNLFLQESAQMNPDRLYHGMILLFFSGYAVTTLNILIHELKLFDKLFTRINELSSDDQLLTMQLVYDVATLSDTDYYAHFPSPSIPPSLFYYAVHWLIFVRDQDIASQYSMPYIRLPFPTENEHNNNKNYLQSRHDVFRPPIVSMPSFFRENLQQFARNKAKKNFNPKFSSWGSRRKTPDFPIIS